MFHWICPECGREIPPSVKECQVCDPNAILAPTVELPVFVPVATAPVDLTTAVAPPPVVEAAAQSVVEPVSVADPEPRASAIGYSSAPLAPSPGVVEPTAPSVVEPLPGVDLQPEPRASAIGYSPAPVAPAPAVVEPAAQPVVEPVLVVDTKPAPAPAPEPVAAEPSVVEPVPVVDLKPEPDPVVISEPIAPVKPIIETAPVVDLKPEPEPAVRPEPAPTADPVLETAALVDSKTVDPDPSPAPASEPEPLVEASPAVELKQETEIPPTPLLAAAAEPLLLTAPVPPEPGAEQQLILPIAETTAPFPVPQFQEVPDPLLALAEEIRGAQAARAAALSAPPESAGLQELAHAVESRQHHPPQPAAPVAPAQQVPQNTHAAEATEAAAVAVLAPPVPETIPEPVSNTAPEPVSLAAPPQPAPQPEALLLPLAPMQNYRAATSKSILPVPPRPQILAADSGPRITLPGPTLPPELTRLQDANVVTVIGEKTETRAKEALGPAPRSGAPGWLVTIGVMVVLLAAGLTVVSYLLPHTVADAKPAPTPAVAATTPAPSGPVSPLSKFIEVSGFRILKSEVQYTVVNHSDADISDVNVFVTLRSVKPGQPPVCRFSFKVPALGPFESKEMSSPIEKSTKPVALPDWQDLRADIQISQ